MQFNMRNVLVELLSVSSRSAQTWTVSFATNLLLHPVKNSVIQPKRERLLLFTGRRAVRTSSCLYATSNSGGREEETTGHTSESAMDTGDKLSYLEARRRGILHGRRRLSPLQRVEGMITGVNSSEGNLETEVTDFSNTAKVKADGGNQGSITPDVSRGHELHLQTQMERPEAEAPHGQIQVPNRPFVDGEYVIITRENLKRQEKLVRLIKLNANLEFKCKFGNLLHADIIGQRNGSIFVTGMDIELLVMRPSLEEFILYMKRVPVIMYPKDCCSMLMMIDASPGDVVLEAGSGSGAMTLFLSRAVGHSGQVLTFERMEAHQKKAIENFGNWQKSWDLSHDIKWPDNVTFYQASLEDCGDHIKDIQVDGAIIDMEEPSKVMRTMSERLKRGKSMAVYVANLTQVIDIAEAIRKQRLPLVLETTLEVSHKVWVVQPARRHAGVVIAESVTADGERLSGDDGETVQGVKYITDTVPRYLTRPHHMQPPHTAFLVKIRRILASSSTHKV